MGWGRMDLVEPPKTEIFHVQKIGNVINSLTHRSDKHVNSPYNIQTSSTKTGNEKTQSYQAEVVIVI